MALRDGDYNVRRVVDANGPVFHNGYEVWTTRCGQEFTGTRTDGLSANLHPVTFLGTKRATVDVDPVTPSPGEGGTVQPPLGGFQPVSGQGGGLLGDEGGPGIERFRRGRVDHERDYEVWTSRPCTRTPGPPAGPFPLGNHVATPLGVQHDGKAVYADGCVECGLPPDPPCGLCRACSVNFPRVWEYDGNGFSGSVCDGFNGRRRILVDGDCRWMGIFPAGSPLRDHIAILSIHVVGGGRREGVLRLYDEPLQEPLQPPRLEYATAALQSFNCCGENFLNLRQGSAGCSAPNLVLVRPENGQCECVPTPITCCEGVSLPLLRVTLANRRGCECLDGYSFTLPQAFPGQWSQDEILPALCGGPNPVLRRTVLRCVGGPRWSFGSQTFDNGVPRPLWRTFTFSIGVDGDFSGCIGSPGVPLEQATVVCNPFFIQARGVVLCDGDPVFAQQVCPLLDVTITPG